MTWSFRGKEQISAAGSGICGKWRPSAVPTITQPSRANYCAGSRAERPTDPDNRDICAEGEFEKICRRNGQEHPGVVVMVVEGGLRLQGCWHSWHGWKGKRRDLFPSFTNVGISLFSEKIGVNEKWPGQFTIIADKQCRYLLHRSRYLIERIYKRTKRVWPHWISGYSAHDFPVRKFGFLHAVMSLTVKVRCILQKWLNKSLCFCTPLTKLQWGSGNPSALCPEDPADRQEFYCDVLASDNRGKATGKLCAKDHTRITSCPTLQSKSYAFDVVQFCSLQMWVKGAFGLSWDWMRIIFT